MKIEQNTADLSLFVDKLIEEKNLPDLGEEIRAEMKSDLMSRLEDRINLTIITNLNEQQLVEFDEIVEKNDQVAIQQYLKKAIPDLETVVATVLLQFRNTYLGI